MFAPEFDCHKGNSVAEAIQLLGANDEAKLIAESHSLIPLLNLRLARPTALIDIASTRDIEHACSMLTEVTGGIRDPKCATAAPSVVIWFTPTRHPIGPLS